MRGVSSFPVIAMLSGLNFYSNPPLSATGLRRGPCVCKADLWEDALGLFNARISTASVR